MRERLAAMGVFAHVVESRSFSAAAAKLGVSKSLVSREVSALERSLSVKLLHRSTRKLSLTEGGAIFHEHCLRVIQEAEFAERRVTQTQTDLTGLVRMTCVQAFALRHLMPVLSEFQTRYPEIRVKLSCSNRKIDLGKEGYDVGIRIQVTPDPDLVARKLAVNRKVLCAAPSYLARRGTPGTIGELADHEHVLFSPLAPKGVWSLRRDGRTHAVPVSARFETDEMDALHAALLAGLGVGAVPGYVAAADLRLGRLVPLLREYEVLPDAGIYLVYLPNRTLPRRVRTLIDFLVQRFAPAPPWESGW